jgi:phosphoribosyl-AMP cyclohydrolase
MNEMSFDPATLTYNEVGLIPAIAQDAATGEVLMMAWMNAEAVSRTLRTGRVTYWSRSRQSFWTKGETSGHVQDMVEMRVDCDRDAILLKVRQTGPACHTGARSCFYTSLEAGQEIVES